MKEDVPPDLTFPPCVVRIVCLLMMRSPFKSCVLFLLSFQILKVVAPPPLTTERALAPDDVTSTRWRRQDILALFCKVGGNGDAAAIFIYS